MMTKGDFKTLQSVLNHTFAKWWVDSGSLLGLVRENSFLKNDKDIDIGVLIKDNGDLENFFSFFAKNGFRIMKFYWGDFLYKCKIIPQSTSFEYILDIQFYVFDSDGYYCCPQMVFKDKLSLYQKIKQKMFRMKKSKLNKEKDSFLKKMYHRLFVKKNICVQMRGNNMFDCYLWRIGFEYLDSELLCINGFPVFAETEKYLTYRYGEWRVPQSKWNFVVDDKSIVKVDANCLDRLLCVNSK